MKKFDDYVKLQETKVEPKHKKEFQKYAVEIYNNLKKKFKELDTQDETKISNTIRNLMSYLGYGESNPNYSQNKNLFPKKYDKALFDNNGGNMYDSVWSSMNDTQHDTIIKKALKQTSFGK